MIAGFPQLFPLDVIYVKQSSKPEHRTVKKADKSPTKKSKSKKG